MSSSVLVYTCLVISFCMVSVLGQQQDEGTAYTNNGDLSMYNGRRMKRSLPKVIELLIKKTTTTFKMNNYRVFYKKGTYRDAVKDFNKLNPTDVVRDQMRTRGKVGNSIVEVYKRETTKRADMRITHTKQSKNPLHPLIEEVDVIEYAPRPFHETRP